jgi:hypothetical protein
VLDDIGRYYNRRVLYISINYSIQHFWIGIVQIQFQPRTIGIRLLRALDVFPKVNACDLEIIHKLGRPMAAATANVNHVRHSVPIRQVTRVGIHVRLVRDGGNPRLLEMMTIDVGEEEKVGIPKVSVSFRNVSISLPFLPPPRSWQEP